MLWPQCWTLLWRRKQLILSWEQVLDIKLPLIPSPVILVIHFREALCTNPVLYLREASVGCPHPNRPLLLSNHPFRLNPPKQLNLPNLPISLELLLHVHNLLQSLPCAPPCPAMVSPLSLQMPSTGSSHLSPQTTHSLPRVE